MGTWGPGIFSNDTAGDVRDGFRELVGAGASPDEATERLLEAYGYTFDVDANDTDARVAWIALAVTQWKTGRLLDSVRDKAVECIDAGADLELWEDPKGRKQREAALRKARADLLSPQRPPTRISRQVGNHSPFSPGDVVRYTAFSGREFAFWAMKNRTRRGLVADEVTTEWQMAAVGDPELPTLEEIVNTEPCVLTREGGGRSVLQFNLWHDQDATPPRWEVIGNAPFPEGWERAPFTFLLVKKNRGADIDRFFDELIAPDVFRIDERAVAVQMLIDAFPALPGPRTSWEDLPLNKATAIAIEIAKILADRGADAVTEVLAAVERLARGDDVEEHIAFVVIDALANIASHPEVPIEQPDLLELLGPTGGSLWQRADEGWNLGPSLPVEPSGIVRTGRARNDYFVEDRLWAARAKYRHLADDPSGCAYRERATDP